MTLEDAIVIMLKCHSDPEWMNWNGDIWQIAKATLREHEDAALTRVVAELKTAQGEQS